MSGINKNGFSLLELLVVMFLIGFMATIVLPGLRNLLPAQRQEQFIEHTSTLLAIAWQQAVATNRVHRLFFDLKKRVMRAEKQTSLPDEKEEKFTPVTRAYDQAAFSWPDTISFKNFYIEGTDQFTVGRVATESIWFYVVPDGMVQEVIMNLEDASVTDERGHGMPFSIVINPFTARLTSYDQFQTP